MDLEMTSIHFLASGSLSIELQGDAKKSPPKSVAVDVVKYRIYVPKEQALDSIGDLKALALKAVSAAATTTLSR